MGDGITNWKPCPFVDGNCCKEDCPLWGRTIIPAWIRTDRPNDMTKIQRRAFEGCLIAAGMLALAFLASRESMREVNA
jgi:uncharacterized radical SAM superfamily protein